MADAAPEPRWTLGDRIYKARRGAGLEQTEVAQLVGVTRQLVGKWERDLSEPGVLQLRRFAEVTAAPWDWLTDDSSSGWNPDDPASDSSRNPDGPRLTAHEGQGRAPRRQARQMWPAPVTTG